MKRLAFLALATALAPGSLIAQAWSAEEQEVLDRVTDCWAAYFDRQDPAANNDCFHEKYSFWWAGDVLPFGKDLVRDWTETQMTNDPTFMRSLRPAAVVVHGNVAIVHWGARGWTRLPDGGQEEWVERISMTLVRDDDGVWRYLGGGGSPFNP